MKFTNYFDGVIEMSDDSDPLLERQSQLPDAVLDDEIVDKNEDEARRYPQRKRTRPKHLEDYVAETDINLAASANDSVDYCYRVANIPNSYAQENCSFEADKWHCAMNEEITALHDNNTFEITPLPEGRPVVGGRCVYAVKLGPNGEEKCTRPDLCYIVSMLSQHMAKPTLAHLGMAKHVLRYVQGTMHYGLKFQKSDVLEVNGLFDSDGCVRR